MKTLVLMALNALIFAVWRLASAPRCEDLAH